MDSLFFQSFILASSIFALVKSADYFIDYAEKIGTSLRLPAFIIGIVVVALGTSLPELATGVSSVLNGETDMMVGNVLGSNVANVLLGLGAVVLIANKSLVTKQNIFHVHFPILIIAMVALIFLAWDKEITRGESLVFWGIGGAYLWFLLTQKEEVSMFEKQTPFHWYYVPLLLISLAGVLVSSELAVRAAINVATGFGIAKTVVSATVIAIGTSLPEMMVVLSALRKNQVDMAVGNILGSNIFNILLILGVGSSISALQLSDITYNVILPFSIASFFVYWAISHDKEITRQEGLAMVFLYLLFVGKLVDLI